MTVVREDQFSAFVSRQLPQMNGILIYGDDETAATDYARQIAQRISGGGADNMSVSRLEGSALTSDTARLDDEFRSVSLLGGRQTIIVSHCEDSVLRVLNDILAADIIGNFIVLVAGSLNKSSKLRAACEKAGKFGCMPLYEAKAEVLQRRVSDVLAKDGLRFAEGAEQRFFALVGDDRSTVLREAEKLVLYGMGQTEVNMADVDASCGDTASFNADELIDAIFDGDLQAADRIARVFEDEGSAARPVLPLLSSHVSRLQNLVLDTARGMSADDAVASAKPMIFFNRRRAMASQVRRFTLDELEQIEQTVSSAIFASRKTGPLASAIANRCLLSVARLARSARQNA